MVLTNTAPGRWFIDFGQDAFGYATLHVNGNHAGTKVLVKFGERACGTAVDPAPEGVVDAPGTPLGVHETRCRDL